MRNSQRVWVGVTCVCIASSLSFIVGSSLANSPASVLYALAEPFLFAALMVCAGWALIASRTTLCLALVLSGVAAVIGIQQPYVEDPNSPTDGPEQLRVLRGCSILSKPVQAPVRIFVWTETYTATIEAALPDILQLRPDIIILNGSDNPKIGSILSDALNGEAKFFPDTTSTESLTAVVRGSFQYCGTEEDAWSIPVDKEPTMASSGVIAFPHIDKIGVFPLLIPRFEKADGNWMQWARTIIDTHRLIADTAFALGTRKLIIAGNTPAPSHANILMQSFQKMGMQLAKSEPNWPTTMGGLPALTLHTLDHAWVGSGWHVQSAKTLDIPNRKRKPVLLDLTPIGTAGT